MYQNKNILILLFLIHISTKIIAQYIVSTTPMQNELNVEREINIAVTFDTDMNPATINENTFIIHAMQTGLHEGIYTYNGGTRTVTLNPDNDFAVGEVVTVILTRNIQTVAGDSLPQFYQWSFTIAVSGGIGEFQPKIEYTTGSGPESVFSSDLDSDGDMDLVVSNAYSDNVSVFLNNGNGSFGVRNDYETGDFPRSIYAADFNSDGYMDIVTSNMVSDSISVLFNKKDGTFIEKIDYPVGDIPYSIFSSDFNGDGYMDLVIVNEGSNNISILLNSGDGIFQAKTNYSVGECPRFVYSSDLDNDRDMDLIVTNYYSNDFSVLFNNGEGIFSEKIDYLAEEGPCSVLSADLNNDGAMDLGIVNLLAKSISLLLNYGNGMFGDKMNYKTGDSPYSIFSADFDNDSDLDLAVTSWDTVSIFLNEGDSVFTKTTGYPVRENPHCVFSSDLNIDGSMDLIVVNNFSQSISILFNKCYESDISPLSCEKKLPEQYELKQNYPNPFNPCTSMIFTLPEYADVCIEVYNISGQKIKTLLNNEQRKAGYHKIEWDGKNEEGIAVANGMYIFRFMAEGHVKLKKAMLIR